MHGTIVEPDPGYATFARYSTPQRRTVPAIFEPGRPATLRVGQRVTFAVEDNINHRVARCFGVVLRLVEGEDERWAVIDIYLNSERTDGVAMVPAAAVRPMQ